MGAWGSGIFDDDTALDIRDNFEEYIEEGLSITEATKRILEEYQEEIEDEDDGPIIHLALASLQIEHGELLEDVKKAALDIIENGRGLEIWEESGEDGLEERKKVLNELKSKLQKH